MSSPLFPEDVLFGRALLAFKLSTRESLNACVVEQLTLAKQGERKTLASIALRRQLITAEQYRRLVEDERKRRATPPPPSAPASVAPPATPPPRVRPQITMSGRYEVSRLTEALRSPGLAKDPVDSESGDDWEVVSASTESDAAPTAIAPPAPSQEDWKKQLAASSRDRGDAGIRERLGIDAGAETFAFGPYRELSFLGAGAAGVVYRALSPDDRPVALKALANLEATERTLRRFLLEAKAASELDHPGIVKVHDFGVLEEIPFMVMDLVLGRELSAILRVERPPRDVLLVMVERICDAVAYAHEKGIVHRDLKPANVMVRYADGMPLLTDFGLAKHVQHDWKLTPTGTTVGTPLYTSPEAIDDAAHATALSDVYSLGVIVYEACCGKLPFFAPSLPELFDLVRNTRPTPPSKVDATSPRVLDAVVARALAKVPAERYQGARELGEALRQAREQQGKVRPTGLLGTLGRLAEKLRGKS